MVLILIMTLALLIFALVEHQLRQALKKNETIPDQKGSANRQKAIQQLVKAHYHVANIRKDSLHQATTWLAKTKSAIVLETLHVNGMLARSIASHNHRLAQVIADVGLHEFRRQLQYKGAWYGCKVFLADRFFPSSKQWSDCGTVKDKLSLSERTYRCENCGLVMDRDWNAAINLAQLLQTT